MASGGSETGAYRGFRAHERQIEKVAARQHRLITTAQLLAAGLSERGIAHRVSRGRLHRIRRGVYCLHPPPLCRNQFLAAAVLACGRKAALCGPTSAALQDIGHVASSSIHVRSPTRAGRRHRGITVHRGEIDPRDLRIVENIRCTSADLVLIELAPHMSESELEVILVAAESKGYLKRGRLGELVADHRGRPGIPKLERLLALEPAIVNSDLELEMLPVWRRAGIERPKVNFPISVPERIRPLIVDFAWPELRMVIEADSQRFHGDWERAKVDRERDQLLALAGWRCHRFPRDRFKEPELMAERVAALARIGWPHGRSDPAAGAAASGERVR